MVDDPCDARHILRLVPLQWNNADVRSEIAFMETRTGSVHRMDNQHIHMHRMDSEVSRGNLAVRDIKYQAISLWHALCNITTDFS